MRTVRLARPASEVRAHYEAVVIGSGYGGGVAASRLARCGMSVAVLERGREILPGEFPRSLLATQRDTQIWIGGRRVGPDSALFNIHTGPDVHVLSGCGVGGTSLINANVCLNPDPSVFEDAAFPHEIRVDHYLNLGFHRARQMLAPAPLPEASRPLKLAALEKAAAAIGREVERVPLHITFAKAATAANVVQPACIECGDCMAGCNVGAKTTVHSTYLADAVNHGAEIFAGATVRFVERTRDGRWRVAFRTGEDSNKTVPRRSVLADIVVVAAGTLGSNEILARSRERGLQLSERLGKRVSTNADAIAFGYANDMPVNAVGIGTARGPKVPPPGPGVVGLIDLRRRRQPHQRLAIVEAAVQSTMAPLLPLMLPAGAALMGRRDAPRSLADLLSDAKGAAESLFGGAYTGAIHKTQVFLAVGHDSASGEIEFSDDAVTIRWPNALAEPVFQAINETLARIVGATGGTFVPNPVSSALLGGNLFTVHPLGGCAMASSRADGVVDHKCRVFDGDPAKPDTAVHDGLYVCDGSVLPRSLGVHPLLTITAVAERALLLLARDRGRTFDTLPKADAPQRSFVQAGDGKESAFPATASGG